MEIKNIIVDKIYFSEREKLFCKVITNGTQISDDANGYQYLRDPYYNKLKEKTKRNRNGLTITITDLHIFERWSELPDNIEDDPLIIKTQREIYNCDGTNKLKINDYIHLKYVESRSSNEEKLKLKLDFLNHLNNEQRNFY